MNDQHAGNIVNTRKKHSTGKLLLITGVILFIIEEALFTFTNRWICELHGHGMSVSDLANLEAMLNLAGSVLQFFSLAFVVIGPLWWLKDALRRQ
ncbi:MAG: hypothetical protein P4L53_03625 [Candidatus Obscuribacterales bacterium]|nr:hypothetical protein [Candidatus Obscuribacterales bacterium]